MEGVKYFIASIPNLFFLEMTGIRFEAPNNATWYISAMIIAMAILYPLCRKYYSILAKIVIPITSLIILGFFVQNDNSLSGVLDWTNFGYKGMIRGVVEVALGVVSFEISMWLKSIKIGSLGKVFLKITEILCYTLVIWYIVSSLTKMYEIYVLALFFIGVTITFSEVVSFNLMNNKFCYFLGKVSLPIYLCHMIGIRIIVDYFMDKSFIFIILLAISMCIFFSIIVMILGNIFRNKIKDIRNKIYNYS